MARIYDNIETKFSEGLQGIINNVGVKRVDFCVGYFNLRGWNLVVEQIDTLTGDYVYENDKRIFRKCRLLIGMHRPAEELIRQLYTEQVLPDANYVSQCKLEIARDFKRQLQLGLPTKQDEFTLRRLSAQMKDEKVCVKLFLREPLHAKLYLAHRPDDNFNKIQAIMGSSNLTYSGLTKQGELNAEFGDSDSAEKLSRWFDDRWEDKFCLDITKELIEIIDNSWAGEKEIPPYYIYLKTAYHLSEEARTGIKEFTIPPEFKSSLFDFQQTAVKIAARHLNNEKRGGAMIGDVVGLGKTITACAIAKMYENTFGSNALIICPANLQDMWAKYRRQYDLKADIMSMAKPIDVDNARYYKLIIVDESHNLRNSQGTRYRNIRDLIQKQDCKVLLLTATPYNKQYKDLSSQLRLFVDDDTDLGIRPEAYIREIGGERKFAEKHEDFIRSIKAFERSECQEDWQELMKLFLVRRTRTFIKDNYAKTDPKNGRKYLEFKDGHKSYFPDRVPKAIKFKTVSGDQYSRLYSVEMIGLMESLKLPRYGLIHYLDEKKAEDASKYEYPLYHTRKLRYFVQFLDKAPIIYNEDGTLRVTSELKCIKYDTDDKRYAANAVYLSTLFFWYFISHSDCRNLNKREVDMFPFSLYSYTDISKLSRLGHQILDNLQKNSSFIEANYKKYGKLSMPVFQPRLSKEVADEIDKLLASHYGFTEEELDFIINYDIKYRMGDELNEE